MRKLMIVLAASAARARFEASGCFATTTLGKDH